MAWLRFSANMLTAFMSLILWASSAAAFKQHWIIVINADNLLYGYGVEAPMYEVAFRAVQRTYPELFNDTVRTVLYQPGTFTAAEAAAVMLTLYDEITGAVKRHPGHWPVMFSPGSSPEMLSLGDYAREMDIPLLSAIASDPRLRDKNRYPTVLGFPGTDQVSTGSGVELFLQRYKLETVTLFCDTGSQYGVIATYYGAQCNTLVSKLQENPGKYTVYKMVFDTKNYAAKDYVDQLETAKRQSRALTELARAGGEPVLQVFFTPAPSAIPGFDDVTWRYFDAEDEVAFEAYKSLIAYKNPEPDWAIISDILEQYANASIQLLNKTIPPDRMHTDMAVTAYESIVALAAVLNESMDQLPTSGGKAFCRLFWNRTFHYSGRDFYINPAGMRLDDTVFSRLNFTSREMQAGWRYQALERTLESISSISNQWKGGNGPPPNEPLCGYRNDLCSSSNGSNGMIIGMSALAVVLLAAAFAFVCWWNFRRKETDALWWLLDESSLHEIDQTDLKLMDTVKAEQRICPWKPVKVQKFQDQVICLTLIDGCTGNLEDLSKDKVARAVLKTLNRMSHSNVAHFFGFVQMDLSAVFMVSEYGHRGSLRSLLQSGSITVDDALQCSLIWEVISGLRYVHASHLRFHGQLCSLDIMVDKRFCVRLCAPATAKFTRVLGVSSEEPTLTSLWYPPEAFLEKGFVGSKEGDIFTLGVLTCEILTKQTPLKTDFADQRSVQASIKLIEACPTDPRMNYSELPSKIREVVSPCFDPSPQKRPTMQKLCGNLERQIPRVQLVDSLVRRLENYAQDLEETVGRRTRELLEEQRKVDELLMEIIPRSLVPALRNKVAVPAELFDLVTILFSDIPLFGSVCAICSPLQTIVLLNSVYSLCDRILSRFDVYKVETINDRYIVASGLPVRNGNKHAGEIAQMALAMLEATSELVSPLDSQKLLLRLGVNTGTEVAPLELKSPPRPCAAGMVGSKMPRYCVFGDTMNTASRMESHGLAGEIHMSGTAKSILDQLGGFDTVSRGLTPIKGKGEMETFWLKKSA